MSAVRGGMAQSPARSTGDFPFTAVALVCSVFLWQFIMISSEVKELQNQLPVYVTMGWQLAVFKILCARGSWGLLLSKSVMEG